MIDSDLAKPKILVVDDDACCCQLLGELVATIGYPVDVASGAEEAFEKICQDDIRIVISDWQMPKMSGLELCRKVRMRRLSGYIYFFLVTSLNRQENLVRGLEAGADDFLSKPVEPEELHVRLRIAQRLVSLETRDLIVFSLAKLAESRDQETGAHLERMREYSRLLAVSMAKRDKFTSQIDADFIRAIFLTSPLHDIGKVGIPDSILLKPGKLTSEEFKIMQQHAEIGCNTLEAAFAACPSAEYLRFASDIAGSHHEKFDGSGYPRGLKGEEIPLSARIVALADVYDALTTKRVYKKAYAHAEARQTIIDSSGQHFDPDVVAAFLEQEEEFLRVRAHLDGSISSLDSNSLASHPVIGTDHRMHAESAVSC
jgi:putative two-component system response regulator